MKSGSYAIEWAAAIERSQRFRLAVPAHQIEPDRRYLTDQRQNEFPHVVQQGLGDFDFSDVVGQCLAMHFQLVPVLEKWLGCPVLYTIGWVDIGTDRGMFRFDEDFIAEKLHSGHSGSSVNIHAWLTLPSMEVIDLTLPTSVAVLQNLPHGYGSVIAKHADDLDGMAYKPMLIGSDFLRKSGLLAGPV